ncbi:MAG: alkaline phosphatase family protein [Verrucomicrobia bacterium]|nr:MAG: alkaline phosphatase family protein [Verrucomicrobiota bacterium]
MFFRLTRFVSLTAIAFAVSLPVFAAGTAKHFVLVVWDGMRPDFVTPELTPTLWQLREQGVWFANHHSVFPTSTEVNGAVLATGCFPQRNGVLANREYRREIDPLKSYETQALQPVRRGDAVTGGKYLRVPTLAELVQKHGGATAVAGSKAVAFLHDRKERAEDSPDPVWFADGALPQSRFAELTNRFGAFPAAVVPNSPRDTWTTRCLTEAFWERGVPRYSVLWLSEPDHSQHQRGVGSTNALAALRSSDNRLATVLQELERRSVRDETDIVVVSDHGFSTIGEMASSVKALQAAGLNARTNLDQPPVTGDVVVVGNSGTVLFYVTGGQRAVIKRTVTTLQRQPNAGVIFSRLKLPGTFPLAEARLDSPAAPDVVMAVGWTAKPDDADGHPRVHIRSDGYTQANRGNGTHTSLSPLDLHNTAVACGPDFRRGLTNALPSGNVDIVPTLLWLMNIKSPEPLDGRVLSETLSVDGPRVREPKSVRREAKADLPDGVWQQHLKFTELNGVCYLDEGNGGWSPKSK